MDSIVTEIFRIEFYGDGLEFASEDEPYIIAYGDKTKKFRNLSSAKQFYDILTEAELIETKYNSVLEGKKRIKIDKSRKRIIDYWRENQNFIHLDDDELNNKLCEISTGVGFVIIYGSMLEHYLGNCIAENFSHTQGEYERTQLFVSELNFSQKCNIVIKDMKSYVHCSYCEIFDFMDKEQKQKILKRNNALKNIEVKINELQKVLESARIIRNTYAHAEYDYYLKGDLISINTKSNKRTGMVERCMKYFTEEDIEEDITEIINAMNKIEEVKSSIENEANSSYK